MNIRYAALTLLAVAAGLSCGESATAPPPPPPTAAVVSLGTPNGDDGALVIIVRGPEVTDIQPVVSSHLIYSRYTDNGREARVIVVGNVNAGPLVTVKLGAGHPLSAYTTSIEQVAMRNDSLRATVTGYQLSLSAAP
jgi:hypothetical protein